MAFLGFIANLLILTCGGAVLSAPSAPEKVIVANSGSHALIIWDATDTAGDLAAKNALDAGAIHDLELRSLKLLAASLDGLPHAQTISIRIVYRQTNANGSYGTQTFEGAVPVAQLSMPIAIARAHKSEWLAPQLAAALPSGVEVRTYDSSNGGS